MHIKNMKILNLKNIDMNHDEFSSNVRIRLAARLRVDRTIENMRRPIEIDSNDIYADLYPRD